MDEVEIFFLAGRYMAETMYYRGNSRNKNIFELILRLVYLEPRGCFRLHIIWVAGTKQITTGIDGFSRGCLIYRISSSGSILDFVLLNETPFECFMSIFPWVRTWIGVNNIEPLNP